MKEVSINTKCEEFKQQIIGDINSSQLPISIVYFIMKDVFQEVEKTYYATLNQEAQEHIETKSNAEVLEENE
ncbi:MAG: hypothetical protein LIO71_03010 [Ruminococcus sp.]|nr:hypothetical protein [Ruminococcus sp.]